jgi:hypothetical protein
MFFKNDKNDAIDDLTQVIVRLREDFNDFSEKFDRIQKEYTETQKANTIIVMNKFSEINQNVIGFLETFSDILKSAKKVQMEKSKNKKIKK